MPADVLCIGVDPGVSGAIAATAPGFAESYDVPTITTSRSGKTKAGNPRKKRQFNECAMVRIFESFKQLAAEKGYEIRALLEDVHSMPKDSKPGAFSFGESKGIIRGMLAMAKISYTMVSPATWRPAMVGRGADKAAAVVLAQRLFPEVDLSKVKDHNRAEALLLADYLRRGLRMDLPTEEEHPVNVKSKSKPQKKAGNGKPKKRVLSRVTQVLPFDTESKA